MKKIVSITSSTEPRFTIKYTFESDGNNQYYDFIKISTSEVDAWINTSIIENFDLFSNDKKDSLRVSLLTSVVDRENKDYYNSERRWNKHTLSDEIRNTKSTNGDSDPISMLDNIYVDEEQESPEDYTMRKLDEEIGFKILKELKNNITALQYERFIKKNYMNMTSQAIADSEGLKGKYARKTIDESLDAVEKKLELLREKYGIKKENY